MYSSASAAQKADGLGERFAWLFSNHLLIANVDLEDGKKKKIRLICYRSDGVSPVQY